MAFEYLYFGPFSMRDASQSEEFINDGLYQGWRGGLDGQGYWVGGAGVGG